MLYRVYEQLVILTRFRHLNGNLKLAGLGDGIDLWGCAMEAYNIGWIRAMGLIDGDVTRGRATGSGWWDSFVGARHGERDTGWIWAVGLIYGGMHRGAGHWLDRAMGLIHGGLPWGHATLAGSGQWDWFMAVCSTGWNGVIRLIHGGLPWGYATLAGSGWWDWFMRVCHGSVQYGLDRGDGIDLWGCVMGVGNWIGVMALISGVAPWGARHRLDLGSGIDLWGHA